ncbi:MAG TPA: sugar transferase [Acidobacteriaceae bacterium]|nr:sugar transferase [Acidobacteriaceae bacterium]
MATSEYLRNDEGRSRAQGSVVQLPARRPGIGPSTIASAMVMVKDGLAILVAFGLAVLLRMLITHWNLIPGAGLKTIPNTPRDLFYLGWFLLTYIVVARRYALYSATPIGTGTHEMRMVVQACLNAGLLLCGALFMFHGVAISRILVMLLVLTASVTLCVRRGVRRYALYRQFAQGIELRNVLILGTNQLSYAMSRHIRTHSRLGYRFAGFVAAPGSPVSREIAGEEILGSTDKLRHLVRQHFIDEVVIAEFYPSENAIQLVQDAREMDVDVRAVSGYYNELTTNAPVEYLGIFPVCPLHRCSPRIIGRLCKRGADLVLSLLALLIAAPLMLVIALAIKLESQGPVLYVSDRIGKRGRVFPCLKFRTMVNNAEKMQKDLVALNERDGVLFKVKNDPRVTRLGRTLRKYSLDELPQFLNVLRGEMSIVGPRPPIASEVEKYELEHMRRLEVLPGLTGLWQVQARHDPSFAKYIALDTAYVENWSFWLDVQILAQTANVVLRGTGV